MATNVVFKFQKEALTRLDELVKKTGSKDRAEVVRRALKLFDDIYEESQNTAVIVRLDSEGNRR